MTLMTATDVSRRFSEVLNRVAAGETIEIVRNGAPVASLGPMKSHFLPIERLAEIFRDAPPIDADFANDLKAARKSFGPPDDPWQS